MTEALGKTDAVDQLERLGRVALVAQGVLYGIVGLLAAQVARGDTGANASQKGAIASVSRQPFGRVLLIVLAVGLVAHALWRLLLAIRGEPGPDDGGSLAKRAANVGRFVIYAGFTVAAVRVVTSSGGGGGSGETERRSTATVLTWPGGQALVVAAGAAVVGAGIWNAYKGVTRSFEEHLDLHGLDEQQRKVVRVLGVLGYLARGAVFALVGWFVISAGLQRDPKESGGLDQALHDLAATDHGPLLLFALAVGMVLFGSFRALDGVLRRTSDITWA